MGTEVTCEWRNMTHTHSWTLVSSSNYVASIADPEQEERPQGWPPNAFIPKDSLVLKSRLKSAPASPP